MKNNINYTELKLGELLSSANDTIKRNAVSILKQLQKKTFLCFHPKPCLNCKKAKCQKCGGAIDIYGTCIDKCFDDVCRKCGSEHKDSYESLCYDCQMKD